MPQASVQGRDARPLGSREADEAQGACRALKRSGFNCFATRS